jgi:hypothetical protein
VATSALLTRLIVTGDRGWTARASAISRVAGRAEVLGWSSVPVDVMHGDVADLRPFAWVQWRAPVDGYVRSSRVRRAIRSPAVVLTSQQEKAQSCHSDAEAHAC